MWSLFFRRGRSAEKELDLIHAYNNKKNTYDRLNEEVIDRLFAAGCFTFKQFKTLTDDAIFALKMPSILGFFFNKKFTIKQLNALNLTAIRALRTPEMCQMLAEGRVSIRELCTLSTNANNSLRYESVGRFVAAGHITIRELNALSSYSLDGLEDAGVCQFIIDGHISLSELKDLSYYAVKAIKIADVRKCIVENKITLEQLGRVKESSVYVAVTRPNAIQQILDGDLSIEQLLTPPPSPSQADIAANRAGTTILPTTERSNALLFAAPRLRDNTLDTTQNLPQQPVPRRYFLQITFRY